MVNKSFEEKQMAKKQAENRPGVYGYVRVSGAGQITGDGFDRQKDEITRYCLENGYELVNVYEERGVSGTKGEDDRPAFLEMVESILSNGIRIIVVEGLDRLAREVRIQESLILYLAAKNITLISARTGENVTDAYMGDPMRKALVQIQAVFSELEKNLLVKKLRLSRERKRNAGEKCEGRKSVKEVSPEIINLIKKLRRKDKYGHQKTFKQIADVLNDDGIASTSGKKWTMGNVYNVYYRNTKN